MESGRMMPRPDPPEVGCRKGGERGGGPLILVLSLLALLGVLAAAARQNVVREHLMGRDALLGAQAACAADSGMLWILATARQGGELLPAASFTLPPGGGSIRWPAATGGSFGFTLTATWLGSLPAPLGETPDRLWKLEVRGCVWPAGGENRAPEGMSCQEALLQVPPASAPHRRVRLQARRSLW